MNAKLAVTLILGLVFQLAQVLPAAVPTMPCQSAQESCDCCTGGMTCHCAENSDSDQKPGPAPFDAGRLLKLPAMKSTETKVSVEVFSANESSTVRTTPQAGPVSGFTGVRLSVAFCSFVI